MSAKWLYPKISPTSTQGRSTAEESFSVESHNNLEILFREAIQNPLDARSGSSCGVVKIHLNVLGPGEFDTEYLKKLLPVEFIKRLETAKDEEVSLDYDQASILVIEDFGTTGLLGVINDPYEDGAYQNWNAFWFREGEGAKTAGSNGGAGQGKVTYFKTSEARALFGLTIRNSDHRSLLMGRSSFRRDYPYGDSVGKFQRDSYWCNTDGEGEGLRITPESDADTIEEFKRSFNLKRNDEPGLSLVIPFVTALEKAEAVRTALLEFYYPIANGKLEIAIKDYVIDQGNIKKSAELFLTDAVCQERKSSFSSHYRNFIDAIIDERKAGKQPILLKKGWEKGELTENSFPEGVLSVLRESISNGERIALRCPVSVRPKKGELKESFFDVYLEVPEEIDKTEEAFIRRDLLIGGEKALSRSVHLPKSRGLTLIEDEPLSSYLVMAEMPNHLIWNGSRQRLKETYKGVDTLAFVRHAMPRLLAFLVVGDQKRDVKVLAKYFRKPSEEQSTRSKPDHTKPKPVLPNPENPKDINSILKAFRLDFGKDYVRILPNAAGIASQTFPISGTLEVAYEGLDHNPFKEYDPFDFDISDQSLYPVEISGLKIIEQKENRLEFEVESPEFELKLGGFEPNVRLRARVTYKERVDEAFVGE